MSTLQNSQSARLSPAFDPIRRQYLCSFARWMLLFALVLGVTGGVGSVRIDLQGVVHYERSYYLLEHCLAAFVSAVLVVGGIRVLIFPLLEIWYDATDAIRDWMAIGIVTGLCYGGLIYASLTMGRPGAIDFESWMHERFGLACFASFVGILLAQYRAIAPEGLRSRGYAAPFLVLLQVVLMGWSFWYTTWGVRNLLLDPSARQVCLITCILALFVGLSILFVAYSQEKDLYHAQREGKPESGISSIDMVMQVTIIGGRHSGKTCCLAGAYQESVDAIAFPNIQIESMLASGVLGEAASPLKTLKELADQIYTPNVTPNLPPGSASCSHHAFRLKYRNTPVAEFKILDYPGEIIRGNWHDPKDIEDFNNRVQYTDLLLLVVDMSALRLREGASDAKEIITKYRNYMQQIAFRNGSRRIVPVALVLTKADEFRDGEGLDTAAIESTLQLYGFDQLEELWKSLAYEPEGPKYFQFSTWYSSAFTETEPRTIRSDGKDQTLYYPLSGLKPTNCLAPIFWLCSQGMRWNYTVVGNLWGWIWGGSKTDREFRKAMLYMEQRAQRHRERGLSWKN